MKNKNQAVNVFNFEGGLLAIAPEKIQNVISLRLLNSEEMKIENAAKRKATSFTNVRGDVAAIGIYGYISQKPTIWSDMGLETSSEDVGRFVDAAIADKSIGAIVLDVDSPGGTAVGLSAISDKIFEAHQIKPIVAVSNSMMASAAYFIGSAASEIVATKDSLTGCVGTIAIIADYSKYWADNGVKMNVFVSEEFKGEGNPYEPMTDEAKANFQKMVDNYGNIFVEAVARNRGKTKAAVKANFGKGRTLMANDALTAGMIDRVGTLEKVFEAMTGNGKNQNRGNSRNQNVLSLLELK